MKWLGSSMLNGCAHDNFHRLCTRNQLMRYNVWAATHQNNLRAQQRHRSAWASARSDQSLCCELRGWLKTQGFITRPAKALIRLGGCPGWSELSLGARHFVGFVVLRLLNIARNGCVIHKAAAHKYSPLCEHSLSPHHITITRYYHYYKYYCYYYYYMYPQA